MQRNATCQWRRGIYIYIYILKRPTVVYFFVHLLINTRATNAFNLPFLFCSPRSMWVTARQHIVTIVSLRTIQVVHGKLAAQRDLQAAPVYEWTPNSRFFICPVINSGAMNAFNPPDLVCSPRIMFLTARRQIVTSLRLAALCHLSVAPVKKLARSSRVFICLLIN